MRRLFQAVVNTYGMGELGMLTIAPVHSRMGEISQHVQIKIKDPDSGAPCGPGRPGEICARTLGRMRGYLDLPDETEEFFGWGDGFARTGDLGYYDKEGQLFFVDRIKELIK